MTPAPNTPESARAKEPRIYVASKTVHAQMWRDARGRNYLPIISTWIDEAGEGETADYSELATRCINEVKESTAVVLYCEHDELLKGAIIEVGAALALGKPVYCVGTSKSLSRVFIEHPLWHSRPSLYEAFRSAALSALTPATEKVS